MSVTCLDGRPPGRHTLLGGALAGALLALLAAWAWPRQGELLPGLAARGERIYLEGVLPDGRRLEGTVQGDVPLTTTACAGCHRRSGFGSAEGVAVVPPVLGSVLYRAAPDPDGLRAGAHARPPYTDKTLLRALRDGVDPTGRALDPMMPRVALSDEDGEALVAYLKSLSAEPDPGVTGDEIHLATIVTIGVDARRRQALLDLLREYVAVKNAKMRSEPARRAHARRTGSSEYIGYRTWVLHVWELDGPPSSWGQKLEELYRATPVFALVGGVGNGSWAPIHTFCEGHHLPCILPDTRQPSLASPGFYTVYFSRGLSLEAEALAAYLRATPGEASRPILQVFRDGVGSVSAAALASGLPPELAAHLVEERLVRPDPPDDATWRALLQRVKPGTVVLWLEGRDVAALAARGDVFAGVEHIILGGGLLADDDPPVADLLRPRVLMTYPWELPAARARHFGRTRAWLRGRGLAVLDARLQANALFAVTVVADALGELRGHFVRDLFLESIEHMLDSALPLSAYPRLSLGPGERFAVKGCYVVALGERPGAQVVPVSEWIVP